MAKKISKYNVELFMVRKIYLLAKYTAKLIDQDTVTYKFGNTERVKVESIS